MKRILLFLLLCATLSTAFAQKKLSPFSNIEIAKRTNPATPEGKRSAAFRNAGETEYVTAFVNYDNPDVLTQLTNYGASVGMAQDGIATVRLPLNRINEIADLEGIIQIDFAKPVYPMMDTARGEGAVDNIHQGNGLNIPYTGKGVVVGVIDIGIEFAHTNFYSADGKELRVKRVWNQLDQTGKPIEGRTVTGGSEYTTPEEIIAHARDSNTETHGTHVGGIATGADNRFGMRGVAPDADIVFVATTMHSIALLEGIKYIFDYAKSVEKPCVINMSIGGYAGPHDGTSNFDRMIDQLVGEGLIFVVSAGNSGRDTVHVSKQFISPGDTLRTFVTMSNMPTNPAVVDLHGEQGKDYKVWYTVEDSETGKTIFSTDTINALTPNTYKNTFTGGEGTILISSYMNPVNGKGNVQFQGSVKAWDNPNYHFVLNATSAQNELHAWTDAKFSQFKSLKVEGFTDGDSDYTISEEGASGNRVVTIGSYNTKNTFYSLKLENMIGFKNTIADISYFSSRGPRADGVVKPTITSPGCYLISSYSSAAWDLRSGNMITHKYKEGDKTYYWGAMQGTSMAAPFAAGVVGLWLQANPTLTPEEVMDIMRLTATKDEFTGIIPPAGSNTWGHGKLNAMEGLKEAIRRGPTGITTETEEKNTLFLLTQKENSIELFFTRNASNAIIEVINMQGAMVSQKTLQQVTKAETTVMELPTKGIYILSVKSDSGTQTQKVAFP